MLGNAYERSAAGDYDPESPRPNGVTGTLGPSSVVPGGASSEGGSQFGSASRGVFGPPPLPSVNPPTHSAFAPTAGRFVPTAPPGLPGATVGSDVPLWPPSKIPTLGGKPPRTFSGHSQQSQASVSRTTSLHSDYGGPRLSSDESGAVRPNDFAPGSQVRMPEQQVDHAIEGKKAEDDGHAVMEGNCSSHDNNVTGWQQQGHPEHSQMPNFGQDADFSGSQGQDKKKPPPAIAKESPLKALYAKGGEKHLEGRRKISLNASLDAAALQPEEKLGHIPPGSQSMYAPESTGTMQESNDWGKSGIANTAPPVFQHNFGTSVAPPPKSQPEEKSHSFNHEPAGFQSFHHSVPQTTEPLSTAEETRGGLQKEMLSKNKGSRKRKGIWPGRRTIFLYFLFCFYVALNPHSALKRMTVAGIGMHAWLSGFLLLPREIYHGMKVEYDTLTPAHTEWSTMIENIYNYSYQASEASWDIVERKIICDTHKQVCRSGRAIVHAPIAASLLTKSILTDIARNAPQLSKMVYHLAQNGVSSSKDVIASIQSKDFKKLLPAIARDSRTLLIGSKDFAICATLKVPRGIHMPDAFDNLLRCWITSFESFLAEKAPLAVDYADTDIDLVIKEVDNEQLQEIASNNDTSNETEYIEKMYVPTDSHQDISGKVEDREPGDDDSYSEYYPQYPEMDQFEANDSTAQPPMPNDSTAQPPMPNDTEDNFGHQIEDKIYNEGFSSEDLENSGIADSEIPSPEEDGKEPSPPELPREPEQATPDDEDVILKRLKRQEEILSPPSGLPDETNDFSDDKIGPPEPTESVDMTDTIDVSRTSEPLIDKDNNINVEAASADEIKDRDEEETGPHRVTTEEYAIKKSLLSPRADESSPREQEAQTQAEEKITNIEALNTESLEQKKHPQGEEETVDRTSQSEFMRTQLLLYLTKASNAITEYSLVCLGKANKSLESLKKIVPIDVGHLMTAVMGAITAVSIVWLKDLLSRRQQGASRMTVLTSPSAVIRARKSSTDNDMKVLRQTVDPLPVRVGASQSRRPARRSTQAIDTTSEDAAPVSPRPRGRRASAARSASAGRSRSKSATATARTRQRAASKASDAS